MGTPDYYLSPRGDEVYVELAQVDDIQRVTDEVLQTFHSTEVEHVELDGQLWLVFRLTAAMHPATIVA